MAQVAGIYYGTNTANCREVNATACKTAGYTYSASYNCYSSDWAYQLPKACLIGTVDPCPTCSTSSVPADLGISSIDSALLAYMFGSALLFWGVGIGLGLMISTIRKTRL